MLLHNMENGGDVEEDNDIETTTTKASPDNNSNNNDNSSITVATTTFNNNNNNNDPNHTPYPKRLIQALTRSAPLGFIAFGGPTAHIALLEERFVRKFNVVDKDTFLELFGVCSALPGPSSTQLVVALATIQAGIPGGLIAFIMWSLPAAIIMTVAGITSKLLFNPNNTTWMSGLSAAATSMVFVAAFQLSKNVVNQPILVICAWQACIVTLLVMGDGRVDPRIGSISFPAVLLIGGLITIMDVKIRPTRQSLYFKPITNDNDDVERAKDAQMNKYIHTSHALAALLIVIWITILIGLITARATGANNDPYFVLAESMFRIGSIIYGGGQVVLPMMIQERYCSTAQFFQGFALVQALPGPLFNFSAFLGGVNSGLAGAVVAVVCLNLPGLLLIWGVLPFWSRLRRLAWFRVGLKGVSAAGLGLIFTACVQLFEGSVKDSADAVVFVCAGVCTVFFKVPVPLAILGGWCLGVILSPLAIGISQTRFCPAVGTNVTTAM